MLLSGIYREKRITATELAGKKKKMIKAAAVLRIYMHNMLIVLKSPISK